MRWLLLVCTSHPASWIATCLLLVLSCSRIVATSATNQADQTIRSVTNDIAIWQREHQQQSKSNRPFITLTYAQSLDGSIALVLAKDGIASENIESKDDGVKPLQRATTSSNFALSDPDSLRMTHALRSLHDGILIGGTTLSVDNPRLSNRLWTTAHDGPSDAYLNEKQHQPRPIVLDTHLRSVKMLGKQKCRAKNVIVCCSEKAAATVNSKDLPDTMDVLPCPFNNDTGRMDLLSLLQQLKKMYNIHSIMVEGGASVLSSFYKQPELVDCICITVAPKLLLWRGLAALNRSTDADTTGQFLDTTAFSSNKFVLLGKDAIFLGRLS